MRNTSRTICLPCYSVITGQSLTTRIISNCKKRLAHFIENSVKEYKKKIETAFTILFTGSILLGGTYLFLSQLARHGW